MKTVDLFCGVGGLSLGFQKAGFKIQASYDAWEKAVKIYRGNFKHPVYEFDLSDSKGASVEVQLRNPEIIIGGPPCQDFSHAGKREEGGRADLTGSFANIVATVRPAWFVMENVDRAQNSKAYANARALFKKAGYGLSENVLDASLCGVPQKRKRFFCVGALGEADGFLDDLLLNGLSKKPMTPRQYLGSELSIDHYYRHPRNYSRRAIFSIDEPAPTVRGVNRPVPPNYTRHTGDLVSLNGIRPLTTLERARIQTFPKEFVWNGTKTDLEQMIGNAVPVELGRYVGKTILKYIMSKKLVKENMIGRKRMDAEKAFRSWLENDKNLNERSASDVTCRFKRVCSLIKLRPSSSKNKMMFELAENEEFQQMSPSIKSQLKRAITLHLEFKEAVPG